MTGFPRVLLFFAQWLFCTPVGLLFNNFGNLSIYYIWNIQASNFPLVPYLKSFATSQLQFKTVGLRYGWVIWTPVGLLFTTFGNLTSYYIWNIQASNFSLVPYLKDFGTYQLEFETVKLY